MVNLFQKTPSKLDDPIEKLLTRMLEVEVGSEESDKLTKQLERLMKLQAEEPRGGINPDTLAVVAGNLLGILTIVAYEQKHVMVSKALGLILRSKNSN